MNSYHSFISISMPNFSQFGLVNKNLLLRDNEIGDYGFMTKPDGGVGFA